MLISFLFFGVVTSVSLSLFDFLLVPVLQEEKMMQNSVTFLQSVVALGIIGVLFVPSMYTGRSLASLPLRSVWNTCKLTLVEGIALWYYTAHFAITHLNGAFIN